ncbi:hypothetical protein CEXT_631431 [Caerostris extrusa]|uniref:Uncharacterized protein n=1 Tax=Caerostris extrusa TaxID=172846 RepID=A0AAV4Y520_CAEEX|nr:hypothetical protein CEXT_631431 [Caerostris extrusa]
MCSRQLFRDPFRRELRDSEKSQGRLGAAAMRKAPETEIYSHCVQSAIVRTLNCRCLRPRAASQYNWVIDLLKLWVLGTIQTFLSLWIEVGIWLLKYTIALY